MSYWVSFHLPRWKSVKFSPKAVVLIALFYLVKTNKNRIFPKISLFIEKSVKSSLKLFIHLNNNNNDIYISYWVSFSSLRLDSFIELALIKKVLNFFMLTHHPRITLWAESFGSRANDEKRANNSAHKADSKSVLAKITCPIRLKWSKNWIFLKW